MVPSGARRVRRRRVPSSAMWPVSITYALERFTPDTGPMAAAQTLLQYRNQLAVCAEHAIEFARIDRAVWPNASRRSNAGKSQAPKEGRSSIPCRIDFPTLRELENTPPFHGRER